MARKLRLSTDDLKQAVEMTGASGEWLDKGNGYLQFRANDGAVLNWWQNSGTLNLQGPQTPRQEFEMILDLAIDRLASLRGPAQDAPEPPQESSTTVRPGRYRHYKGKEYQVIGLARHSETMEELVVYRALYGEQGLWVRPKAMFSEMVSVDGEKRPRFEFLG